MFRFILIFRARLIFPSGENSTHEHLSSESRSHITLEVYLPSCYREYDFIHQYY